MAFTELGEVTSPTGGVFKYFWDSSSGDVRVANEYAGKASNESEAWRMANFYATTKKIMQK
ncbi:MAG: hypothetical protein AUK48_11935 [Oscillatoriales cyanobacterium CG2_30_44_21]|nr:MAG: hypothetical protein AUK48_11935 [Oscillatoriales cyanobacterium CG2_30_44_21]